MAVVRVPVALSEAHREVRKGLQFQESSRKINGAIWGVGLITVDFAFFWLFCVFPFSALSN